MEIAGLAVGIAGLSALFESCLRGFELFEQSKDFGRNYTILLTRLDAQKLLFLIWGEAIGLHGDGRFSDRNLLALTSDVQVSGLICRHLKCIQMIFEDADQLRRRYGVIKPKSWKLGVNSVLRSVTPEQSSLPLRRHVRWFQNQTSYKNKARWAIQDQAKFKTMLDDLSALLQQLRDITLAVADIQQQRKRFTEEIDSCDRIEDIEIIEEALSEEDPAFSSAASERRMVLTEAAMTTMEDEREPESDSDVVTHADVDTEAQVDPEVRNPLHVTDGSEQPCMITVYGHSNNLSEIQSRNASLGIMSHVGRGDLSRHGEKRIQSQLHSIWKGARDTPFISIGLHDDRLDYLVGSIQAPPNTPYEGGVYFLAIRVPADYPLSPPRCRFLTPIYHPNIDCEGLVCLNILKADEGLEGWSPIWSLELVLMGICSLLGSPQYEDAIEPEIAEEWRNRPYEFEVNARLHTQRHAKQKHQNLNMDIDWVIPAGSRKRRNVPTPGEVLSADGEQSWMIRHPLMFGAILAIFMAMFFNLGLSAIDLLRNRNFWTSLPSHVTVGSA